MSSPYLFREGSPYDTCYRWDAPTPGSFHGTPASPSNLSYISSNHVVPTRSQRLDKLTFLELEKWQDGKVYDDQPPSCIQYTIEWKVALNKRVEANDTEQNVVLAPSAYWERTLKHKLEKTTREKFLTSQRVRSDDTAITVAINDRSEHNLTKRFEKANIDWSSIENQLLDWGDLFRAGKKLRLMITFYYIGDSRSSPKKGDKRGSSATQRMQAEMDHQLEAERISGLPDTWRHVYQLMRCRDKLCKQGPHCLEDPKTEKHYALTTHHLQSLIDFVHDGGLLRTERDIPNWFFDQLKAEEQLLKPTGKSKGTSSRGESCPPINIVLPAQALPQAMQTTTPAATPEILSSSPPQYKRLDIFGPRDVAVSEYSEWHAAKWTDEEIKNDYRKACQVALKNGLDLEQIVNRPDPQFFIQREVRIGTAHRFVGDIVEWAEYHCKEQLMGFDTD